MVMACAGGPALGAGAGGAVVRAEVDEVGVVVGEQRPDDDEEGAAGHDDGAVLDAASGDPSVALAQERVGAAGRDGLAEDSGQARTGSRSAAPVATP
jgi:hypothetical protein